MKQLALTTWERMALLSAVPVRSKTITDLCANLRVVDLLELSQGEKKQIGWKQAGEDFTWDKADLEWAIDFEDADHAHLIKLAKQYQRWPTRKETKALLNKLGLIEGGLL